MYTESFESDAKVWVTVLKNSLHSGNGIGCARLHMVQQMIKQRLDWQRGGHFESEHKFRPTMEACIRLCEFGKQREITAAEKNIYIHTMIDLLETELRNLPSKHTSRSVERFNDYLHSGDLPASEPVGDVYPTEDSPDYLIPPADIDDIPF